jgi:L-cysteine:1D-myo-inositol 2-amino-2-deoxy-alpha-D-glucopyranoside ligase
MTGDRPHARGLSGQLHWSGSYPDQASGYAQGMYAWPASEVPALPGRGRDLRIHDTATGGPITLDPGPVARLYVCGITPYDATHLGHAATYNAFDLVQRVWLDTKRQVHYVQNVTDVDDPLLERAVRDGEDWTALAERETALFREDMTALRMLPPRHFIGAVEAIPGIVPLVERLREAGAAYELEGDIYFSVESDPAFGQVSGLGAETMRLLFAERGGDPERPGKKNPLDPILWLAARDGEPSWDGGSLGRGRPGWHIECVAIALDHLGMAFDVQGGGSDLAFPHHEMGASHAQVVTGEQPFAKAYVHAGMVALNGEKMSKSKGNLVFVSTLRRDGVDPAAIRLALLSHHYRADWEWTDGVLEQGLERLDRWRSAVSRPDGPPADALVEDIREALANDLDAPAALAAVDRWAAVQQSDGGTDESAPGVVSRAVDALLGVAL